MQRRIDPTTGEEEWYDADPMYAYGDPRAGQVSPEERQGPGAMGNGAGGGGSQALRRVQVPQSFGPGSGIAGLGGGYDPYGGGYGGGYGDPYGGYGGGFGGGYDPYGGYGGGYDPGPALARTQPELLRSRQPPPTVAAGETPYVSSINQTTTMSDPTTPQLLFGLGGKGGFIPGAMQAAETTFFNPDGTPRVTPQEVAGFTPDQQRAMELARGQVGIQDRYLTDAEAAFEEGVRLSDVGLGQQRELGQQALGSMERGVAEEQLLRDRGLEGLLSSIGEGRQLAGGATSELYERLGETEGIQRGATERFGGELGGIEEIRRGAAGEFGQRLGESEALIRGTTGAYDQDLTRQFYDPYEDRVVRQTIEDVLEGGAKADMAQFAQDIARGGESAFGSRARLTAGERREDLGRGLAKELAGIRSRGFTEAQRMGTSEFARQRAAERGAGRELAGLSGQRLGAQQQLASGLGSLSGQRLGAERGLASGLGQTGQQRYGAGTGLGATLVGLGQTGQRALYGAGQAALGSAGQLAGAQGQLGSIQGQIGQQQLQSRQGLGGFMQGLGGQAQQAGLAGISSLAGFGGQQQQLTQQQLNAQRQNLLTAQQAPMAQYQSLLPFIQAVPAGTQQTQIAYDPKPSALQAGLATGLGAFGAIGNYMNPYGGSPYINPYGPR